MLTSLADRPIESANAVACLEDAEVIPKFAELVPHDQPGNAGAEYEHFGSTGSSAEARSNTSLSCHQIPRRHRRENERRTSDDAELLQKSATCEYKRLGG